MSTNSFLTTLRHAFAVVAIIAAAPAMIFAQGETFTDCDAWEAAVCGSILDDDFESFVGFNGVSVPSPQMVTWGDVSQQGTSGVIGFTDSPSFLTGVVLDSISSVEFTPNVEVLGALEGVCFDYQVLVVAAPLTFNAYDGETLVATHTLPAATDTDGNPAVATFGWQNTDGLNITRFEFAVEEVGATGIVGNGQLSFGDGCDPPAESCFDQLAVVEANLEAYVDTLSGCDAYFAQGSLDCINWMQNDCFWVQPSGNRLSRYGGSMFIGAAYAVCYLEWVDTPEADVLIDDLLAVLECIVDQEIAYAIENGGSQCFIDRAEDYAELGDIIDEDFDNQVIATLAYRLAWLNAYYATQ